MEWGNRRRRVPTRAPPRGRGGRATSSKRGTPEPPAYPWLINPAHPLTQLTNPRVRGQFEHLILQEHKWQTGEMPCRTPGNNLGGNLPREGNTGIRVTLEFQPQIATQATSHNIPGVPCDEVVERHKQELLNGIVQMRTQLFDSYFYLVAIIFLLHFLTYIWFLCTL